MRSWRNNWSELSSFYDFPVKIRKIIYTINIIENLKDDALKKSVYLTIAEIEKKCYQPIWN
ncbi:MAG: transposase [Prevotellaceae bacterium]|nr:transposase [Prevotellaceae bacterium]